VSFDVAKAGQPLDGLSPREAAVFLDFDGVLVDIAPTPDAVSLSDDLVSLLAVLDSETGGACAVVTGRAVEDLRRHLPLVPHAVIGCHGAESYLPGAPAFRHPQIGSDTVARLHDRAAEAERLDGVLVERKPTGLALHHGAASGQEAAIREIAQALLATIEGFDLFEARAVMELRPAGIGKERALAHAMTLPVFADRIPVYFGHDATDEAALGWVAQRGGVAVKVGPGDSVAPHRLAGPPDVQAALAHWLETETGWWDR
jgi:trehalose 6-phosphate phosphatase